VSGLGVWPPDGISRYRLTNVPHALSLGVGVQSSTLLMMAEEGLVTPKPAAAIFSDTTAEPDSVYRWVNYLRSLKWSFPLHVVSKGDLSEDNLKKFKSRKSGKQYVRTIIPTYIRNPDGSRGVLGRRCTGDYKIRMVEQALRQKVLRRRLPSNIDPTMPLVISWIGISTDEADRMKPAKLPWVINRWPLIELGMSREDCKAWVRQSRFYPAMLKAGFTEPPRSACKQCPYHSDVEWIRMRDEEPEAFQFAVEWERRYTKVLTEWDESTRGTPFLHNSLVPLDQVIFDPNKGRNHFSNECEGMCGV